MSSNEKNYNVFVVSRDENMQFVYEKSINNTIKKVKKQSSFSFINLTVSKNHVQNEKYCLNFLSKLIQTLIKNDSFDETTITMFQINATKMFMQIVIETKNSKTTTTCVKIDFFDQNY